jgi:diadenosine tetraphosphate (Ap4A) HIT family hydrolase|tara:strand:- start:697 stop:1125 length:429 start_codon:yes stop_codon:yes gene_type:complete
MLYEKYLKKKHPCPFCNLTKEEILKQNKCAILTLAKAPYTKDHLLVVPKKHYLKFNAMTKAEKDCVDKLVSYALKKLHKKHKNITVLYREGDLKQVGKSIPHLHYHIIPNMVIGAYDINWKKRKIYSEEKYIKEIKKLKKRL